MAFSSGLAEKLPEQAVAPAGASAERVITVTHYTDRLFSFRITRPQSFRFRSGEFVMIGLPNPGIAENGAKPVFRAYSIASPAWDEELEFFSIKVPDGPLTARLQKIVPGDTVFLRQKSTGTLVLDALTPGKRLFLFATGTGIAPFASVVRDPETFEKFESVILTNTCRTAAELAYGDALALQAKDDPLIGELTAGRLTYYRTTTREPLEHTGRITTLIQSGKLFADLGIAPFDAAHDRAMICGSMHMLQDVKALLEAAGLTEGSNAQPAEFVVERAFVG
jgi:ferredoxin/flavodoxin---NADP+ reductase